MKIISISFLWICVFVSSGVCELSYNTLQNWANDQYQEWFKDRGASYLFMAYYDNRESMNRFNCGNIIKGIIVNKTINDGNVYAYSTVKGSPGSKLTLPNLKYVYRRLHNQRNYYMDLDARSIGDMTKRQKETIGALWSERCLITRYVKGNAEYHPHFEEIFAYYLKQNQNNHRYKNGRFLAMSMKKPCDYSLQDSHTRNLCSALVNGIAERITYGNINWNNLVGQNFAKKLVYFSDLTVQLSGSSNAVTAGIAYWRKFQDQTALEKNVLIPAHFEILSDTDKARGVSYYYKQKREIK